MDCVLRCIDPVYFAFCCFLMTSIHDSNIILGSCSTQFRTCEEDVQQVFRRQKTREAPGPDGVSPSRLKVCADQVAPIITLLFNRSLQLCVIPSCFKHSTIIPVSKKPLTTELNDSRPVALMSAVFTSFERLVLPYLQDITSPQLGSAKTGQQKQHM